jgi:hypothetical protein
MKAAASFLAVYLILHAETAHPEAPHLTSIRQLTSGGQNAEAYWSPDGRRLIFNPRARPTCATRFSS